MAKQAAMRLVPASSVKRSDVKIKVLGYGKSGVGKTRFAAHAPRVAFALVESQGFATIKEAQTEGAEVMVASDHDGDTPYISTTGGLRAFCVAAARKEIDADVIVFDSITEIQKLFMAEILGKKTQLTKADWGQLGTKMANFLRLVRDLDYHVIVLGLADWHQTEDGEREMSPLVKGSTSKDIAGYFNLVAYFYRRQDENSPDGVSRYAMTDGDDLYATKPYGGLAGILVPNFDLWLRVLSGEVDPSEAIVQGAPLPGTTIKGAGGTGRKVATFGNSDDPDEE